MRLPWSGGPADREEQQQLEVGTFEHERQVFEREILQIKKLNEYLLNRAVAEGRISEETAASIRMTQSYAADEVLDLGSAPPHHRQST
jgi:hypothetical protein